ncbi:histone-lysine N-methyltransferase SETMAR [Trichonephila clavipes]|nr:histone-lysine N-methyltransferase SETMAR [Trichonephila clavipes]
MEKILGALINGRRYQRQFSDLQTVTEEKMQLTREHYRAMIFYNFKAELNQQEFVQRLQLAFGDESPCRATVFRWFKEFCSRSNSLQEEEHTGRPRSAVIPDNVSATRKYVNG